jgi:two-component system chemotaxis sensor kinase CheA
MFKLDLGKYRTMVLAIGLFLLFDLGVLTLNFVISSEIRSDALNVNVVGRQRMLSQRMAKATLQIRDRMRESQPYRELLMELERASEVFDQTLLAYLNGGMVSGASTADILVKPVADDAARALLTDTQEQWMPYRDAVLAFVRADSQSLEQAQELAHKSEVVNVWLLSLSNDLTSRVEELAAAKATTLQRVQMSGMLLATLNFLLIMFHFIRHLRRSDSDLEQARKETSDILRTTQEGLFLLDTEFRMGSQTSGALAKVLGRGDVAGRNFLDILKPMVTAKTFDTTKEYIELLLRHDVKEKLVTSLNPLDCVELSSSLPDGSLETRFLQFRFNRVLEGEKVTHLLVTTSDITRRVRLERELADSERKVQDQMGMMVHILQADPLLLGDFLKTAGEGLDQINEALRDNNLGGGAAHQRIDQIFRISHRLKGDAAGLKLEAVNKSLQALEEVLAGLRGKTQLQGEDFLPVTVRVKALYAEVNAIQAALARVAQIRGVITVESPKPQADPLLVALPFVRQWRALAEQMAERAGKKIDLNYQGLQLDELAPSLREAIVSIVNQFLRNAVAHGIETPAERKLRGKAEAGRVAVYLSDSGDGGIELSFRDDGAGVDPAKVREAAVRAGKLSAEAAGKISDVRRLIALIFESGVSTRSEADQDAGQGVGLDSVKDMVTRLGGRIRIGSTIGEYCHFRVFLPRVAEPRQSLPQPATAGEEAA